MVLPLDPSSSHVPSNPIHNSTDELFKSSAFLTEAYHLDAVAKHSREPTHAPFNFAFGTTRGFFGWLE